MGENCKKPRNLYVCCFLVAGSEFLGDAVISTEESHDSLVRWDSYENFNLATDHSFNSFSGTNVCLPYLRINASLCVCVCVCVCCSQNITIYLSACCSKIKNVWIKPSRRSLVGRVSVLSHAVRLDPRLEPHHCLCASTWMKWLTCHTDCQDISRYHTRGESVESVTWRWWGMQARESTLALKARTNITRDSNRVRCHQSSKIGVSVAHKKDLCPQFFLKKVWIKYVIEEDKSQKFDPVAKLIVLCNGATL